MGLFVISVIGALGVAVAWGLRHALPGPTEHDPSCDALSPIELAYLSGGPVWVTVVGGLLGWDPMALPHDVRDRLARRGLLVRARAARVLVAIAPVIAVLAI